MSVHPGNARARAIACALTPLLLALPLQIFSQPAPKSPRSGSVVDLTKPVAGAKSPSVSKGAYADVEVDVPVVLLPNQLPMVYPELLRTAGIEGKVVARFIIDTSGQVERTSIKVLSTDNDLFTDAVREWLLSARFSPARVKQRKVRQVVQQPFDFSLTKRSPVR
jgi:protein TonB